MKYGLDMVSPPSIDTAERMRDLGWSWCGVYVGGPRATSRKEWQIVDGERYPVGTIAPYFKDGFLPIYVGRNAPWDITFTYELGLSDGEDANASTGACGFDVGTPLALDVEQGTFSQHPAGVGEYIRGWVESVNNGGHPAGLYSDIETLGLYKMRPDLIDFLWGASWVNWNGTAAPEWRFDPSLPPPWQVWQFANGTVAGTDVDFNSASDDFQLAFYGL